MVECYAAPNYHRSLTTSRYSTVCYLETLSDTSDLSDTSESSEDTSAYYGGTGRLTISEWHMKYHLVISISP